MKKTIVFTILAGCSINLAAQTEQRFTEEKASAWIKVPAAATNMVAETVTTAVPVAAPATPAATSRPSAGRNRNAAAARPPVKPQPSAAKNKSEPFNRTNAKVGRFKKGG